MGIDGTLYGRGLVGDLAPPSKGPLRDRFNFAPFSVFNTREEWWQNRKRAWLGIGISSEVGRADKLTYNIPIMLSDGRTGNKIRAQTSIFDPVLCELILTWWCPQNGIVIDPFAGGSVRGIIASMLDRKYWGCELRAEQVEANRAQVNEQTIGPAGWRPKWCCGDSLVEVARSGPPRCNMVFSCPPYGNLEAYSDDPRDISNMTYEQFLENYRAIIAAACAKLEQDSFAVFVVANFRDKKTGRMRDFVADTTAAFTAVGLEFYNEAILVNAVGSAAMRANTSFIRGHRKLVKTHQNILVYVKGSPKGAAEKIGTYKYREGDENIPDPDDGDAFQS